MTIKREEMEQRIITAALERIRRGHQLVESGERMLRIVALCRDDPPTSIGENPTREADSVGWPCRRDGD
jgi:hypothetical protein